MVEQRRLDRVLEQPARRAHAAPRDVEFAGDGGGDQRLTVLRRAGRSDCSSAMPIGFVQSSRCVDHVDDRHCSAAGAGTSTRKQSPYRRDSARQHACTSGASSSFRNVKPCAAKDRVSHNACRPQTLVKRHMTSRRSQCNAFGLSMHGLADRGPAHVTTTSPVERCILRATRDAQSVRHRTAVTRSGRLTVTNVRASITIGHLARPTSVSRS